MLFAFSVFASAQCFPVLPSNTYSVTSTNILVITSSTPQNVLICANAQCGDSAGGAGSKKFYVENGGILSVKPSNNSYTVIVKSGGTFNAEGGSSATVYYETGAVILNNAGPPLPPCPAITFDYSQMGGNPCIPSGTQDFSEEQISLFPVPANDQLHVLVPGNNAGISWSVFNILGELVVKGENTGSFSIPVTDLTRGVYILDLTVNNKRVLKKFVRS